MGKPTTIILFILLGISLSAAGFLGYLYSHLNSQYQVLSTQSQATSQQKLQELNSQISTLKQEIQTQNQSLTEQVQIINDLQKQIEPLKEASFLPAPQYSLSEIIFTQDEKQGNKVSVVGNKDQLARFLERNEIYLDYLMKKSMPLSYDFNRRSVVVSDMVPGSIFEQMGLKKGDLILNINGAIKKKGAEIRSSLIEPSPKKISVVRDQKRLVLDLKFEEPKAAN